MSSVVNGRGLAANLPKQRSWPQSGEGRELFFVKPVVQLYDFAWRRLYGPF